MKKPSLALAACALLAACQPRPVPTTAYVPPRKHPLSAASSRAHRPTFANGQRSTGSEAQFATDCPWPAHAHPASASRLSSSTIRASADGKTAGVEAEGCAILRFSLSPGGTVSWIEVVSAKPSTIGPLALKCLLAARFKPDPHPEATSLVRVDVRKLPGDVAVAALKLR